MARSDSCGGAGVAVDHVSKRRVILGLGRGLARIEYEGFRIGSDEGRNLFVEYADGAEALETGYMRRSTPAAAARDKAVPGAIVQGPYLCGGGVAGIDAASWPKLVRVAGDFRRSVEGVRR